MNNLSGTRRLTYIAIMAAVICVLAPWSIPIGPVPISLGLLGVFLAAYILGPFNATLSVLIYLLLGVAGLPVFSGFAGGLTKVAGPTGGYLVGYLFVTLIAGFAAEYAFKSYDGSPVGRVKGVAVVVVGMLIGLIACYALGTVWFMMQMDMGLSESLALCVYPFIPFDAAKIALAIALGMPVRSALKRAALI